MEMIGHLHAPAALPPGYELPIGGSVGPRAGLNAVPKKKIHCAPAGNRTPVVQSVG
jgi:hypothetical protein